MTNANDESKTGTETVEQIDRLTFGVEIETYGLGHYGAAAAIHEIVGGTNHGESVTDRWGRRWNCVCDGSIEGHNGTEIVTPPLRHSHDMSLLQEVVRNLRAKGARVNSSCGIHVHVGLTSMGRTEKEQTKAVKNLCNIVHKHQENINLAIGCGRARQAEWAAPLPTRFVEKIRKARKLDDIMRHYYPLCGRSYGNDENTYSRIVPGGYGANGHYNGARYSGLNLHNLKFRTGNARTVEFRLFDATLHAGHVRAIVTFCLAMAARAANVSRTSFARANEVDGLNREQARWFLKTLGLVGDRFDTVREFCCDKHFDIEESRRVAREYREREDRRRVAA